MIRRSALAVFFVVLLGALAAPAGFASSAHAAAATAAKPNVLVIMADDMRYSDMKYMTKTKKLLGEQGTTFSKNFVTYPLCCPARTTFLTGQLAHNHGVESVFSPDNYIGWETKANNMGTWLQKAGWQTGLSGKYLNGYGELNQTEIPKGWNDWRGSIDESTIDAFNTWINVNGKVTKHGDPDWSNRVMQFSKIVGEQKIKDYAGLVGYLGDFFFKRPRPWTFGTTKAKDYTTKVEADGARAFIAKSTKSKKRWFSYYTPPSQHREDVAEQANLGKTIGINPRVPEPYLSKVKNLPLDKSAPSFAEDNMSDKRAALQSPLLPNLNSDLCKPNGVNICLGKLTDYTRGRAGASLALDDQVANIMGDLKKSGQLDKTLIIFTSDNGWLLGEHNIPGDKFMPYDESIHVPLLMRGPGVPKGKVNNALVANVDLSPTIVDATGATPERTTDGMSLLKLIKDPSLARTAVPLEALRKLFIKPGKFPNQWDVPYYGVRTKDYMYAKYVDPEGAGTGEEELYNLVSDPYEMNNLAANPAYAAKLAEMAQLALELRTCQGAACVR